jgi:hypothetical protein
MSKWNVSITFMKGQLDLLALARDSDDDVDYGDLLDDIDNKMEELVGLINDADSVREEYVSEQEDDEEDDDSVEEDEAV